MTDRDKWGGFVQILKTPPKEGEVGIGIRDFDGVNGEFIIWSTTNRVWEFTGVRLQDIPPLVNQSNQRVNKNGRRYNWDPDKNRWWGE